MGTRTFSPEEGVYSVLKYELGYGATVAYMDEQKVTFRTLVLGKVNHVQVEFESDEERKLMFTMLFHWYEVSDEVNNDDELMKRFFETTGGVPFFVVHALPVIIGGEKVLRTLLACMGLADKPEVVEKLKGVKEEDIVVVAELVREGSTWEEALESL